MKLIFAILIAIAVTACAMDTPTGYKQTFDAKELYEKLDKQAGGTNGN